ncbi:M20 family metallopeptidase [Viridibacillus sp. FSL E2-0187]|uniref:M20 family metallopeptidase n=1 Tax=Viridibacillus TaxID=496496 RepID=UPI00187B25D5|nr:M20 family metallopeptidase [Viridibacillus sp. JNUCC-6]QOV09278.1 amidohydrolase [Viridibacillus sp. JNUCC-6]
MKLQLFDKLDASYKDMVQIRRHLHMYPEVSFNETETAKYIQKFYDQLGVVYEANVGGNGVVARVKGAIPGKTIALRADFDALPIQELNDVPYKSTVAGVMHACGHDGHTATLLQLAKALHEMRDQLAGEYVIIHQHAEEIAPGGAKPMVEAGCLDGVDAVFGTHLWSQTPFGTIEHRSGPMMASADRFEISIHGRGGHGAMPQDTIDTVTIGAQLVTNLQHIVSRRVDPIKSAVVTIGSFHAGDTFNVIAGEAKMSGTVRTFLPEVRDLVEAEIERIIKGTCLAADCDYTFEYIRGYPAVVNHEKESAFLFDIAKDIPGVNEVVECAPLMVGEDFSYYLEKVPGVFFFTGAMPEGTAYAHHHAKFDFREEAMLIAAKTLGAAVLDYQNI